MGGSERGWGEGGPELVNFFHRIQMCVTGDGGGSGGGRRGWSK